MPITVTTTATSRNRDTKLSTLLRVAEERFTRMQLPFKPQGYRAKVTIEITGDVDSEDEVLIVPA